MTLYDTTKGTATPYDTLLGDYQIVEADAPELRDACYRLRYQVYCVENQYEDSIENPGRLESDIYDRFSVHGLIIHRPTGMAAGTLRLILPSALPEGLRTPFQMLCDHPFAQQSNGFQSHRAAEVSRIGVSKFFQRLALEQYRAQRLSRADVVNQIGIPGDPISHIIIMLFRAVAELSFRHGLNAIAAMMDSPIIRLYARYGVHIPPLGSKVEFHGLRQPCFGGISDILARTRLEHPDVWNVLSDNGRFVPSLPDSVAAE